MKFKVTVTKRAAAIEEWIRGVKQEFLDNAQAKCVGLDCEFTDAPKKAERRYLPAKKKQCATVL